MTPRRRWALVLAGFFAFVAWHAHSSRSNAASLESAHEPRGSLAPHANGLPDSSPPTPQSFGDWFDSCARWLTSYEEPRIRSFLQSRYRLSPDDAHDIVRDALLAVCTSHAQHRYTNLGAVLQTASIRRATDGWRRRQFERCAVDENLPSPGPSPDTNARFPREDDLVESALCTEDRRTREIFFRHLADDEDFATIATALSTTADEVRWTYNNALRRIRKRVQDAAPASRNAP